MGRQGDETVEVARPGEGRRDKGEGGETGGGEEEGARGRGEGTGYAVTSTPVASEKRKYSACPPRNRRRLQYVMSLIIFLVEVVTCTKIKKES